MSTTIHLEKSEEKKEKKKGKHESVHNILRIFGTKLVLLVDFCDHIYKTVSQIFFCCFLPLTQKSIETCVNCVTKCLTAKI